MPCVLKAMLRRIESMPQRIATMRLSIGRFPHRIPTPRLNIVAIRCDIASMRSSINPMPESRAVIDKGTSLIVYQ